MTRDEIVSEVERHGVLPKRTDRETIVDGRGNNVGQDIIYTAPGALAMVEAVQRLDCSRGC